MDLSLKLPADNSKVASRSHIMDLHEFLRDLQFSGSARPCVLAFTTLRTSYPQMLLQARADKCLNGLFFSLILDLVVLKDRITHHEFPKQWAKSVSSKKGITTTEPHFSAIPTDTSIYIQMPSLSTDKSRCACDVQCMLENSSNRPRYEEYRHAS
jgi:hypothetical protein